MKFLKKVPSLSIFLEKVMCAGRCPLPHQGLTAPNDGAEEPTKGFTPKK
jgi:hypothetical protein